MVYIKKEDESQKEFEERISKYHQNDPYLRIRQFETVKQFSDSFIDQNSNLIEFDEMLLYDQLPEDFLRKHFDKFYIQDLCIFQKNLPENFIIDYADKLNWENISTKQKLSKKIIKEFFNKIDFRYVPICCLNIKHEKSWKEFL